MGITSLITFFVLMFGSGHRQEEVALNRYPHVGRADARDRILIVAPHVDDEAIAAGGFAFDAVASGAEVYVVFLTAGDCSRMSARILSRSLDPKASHYLSVGRTRIAEASQAMKMLGVPSDHFFVLGYPDGGLKAMVDNPHAVIQSAGTRERSVPYADAMSPGLAYSYENIMQDMQRVLTIARPTTVIAPVSFDGHADHSATATITARSLRAACMQPRRLSYLVHTSPLAKSLLRIPSRALMPPLRMRTMTWETYPLSREVQKAKDALLQSYKSQRPYTYILRSSFVRSNELFFVDEPLPLEVAIPAAMSPAIALRRAPMEPADNAFPCLSPIRIASRQEKIRVPAAC